MTATFLHFSRYIEDLLPVHLELLFNGNLFTSFLFVTLLFALPTKHSPKSNWAGMEAFCQVYLDGSQRDRPIHVHSLRLFPSYGVTSPKTALDIARYFAVMIDDVLPFSVADFAGKPTLEILCCGTTQTFFALASKLKIARSQTKRQNLIPRKIGWRPKARS